jgi:hypothetical protein
VFASAIANSNDPASAIAWIDLSTYLTFDCRESVPAFQIAIRYMRTRGVNTAILNRPLTRPTESASGHYTFGFQIECIIAAQKLQANRLVELLALEVRREWLHFPLRRRQFSDATRVDGALNQFLLDWIVEIEHEKDEQMGVARQKALVKGIEESRGFRTFLSDHFNAKPGSRGSILKFGKIHLHFNDCWPADFA